MSEKAVGSDWKKKNRFTLRHATGCAKFTTIKVKKQKNLNFTFLLESDKIFDNIYIKKYKGKLWKLTI